MVSVLENIFAEGVIQWIQEDKGNGLRQKDFEVKEKRFKRVRARMN